MSEFDSDMQRSSEYWESKRQFYLAGFDINRDLIKYEKYLSNKKGLLYGSHILVDDSINLIACGLDDLGFEKASMAMRFAESAISVGDLIYPNEPVESGMYLANNNIAWAKWILGKINWESHIRDSANYWCEYISRSGIVHGKFPGYLKTEHLWKVVIPFLLIDDVDRASLEYRAAVPGLNLEPNKTTLNAKNVIKTLGVIIRFLEGKHELQSEAKETLIKLRLNISKWGTEDGSKIDQLWKEIFIPQHVLIARLWANLFSDEKDPAKIIRSIRACK